MSKKKPTEITETVWQSVVSPFVAYADNGVEWTNKSLFVSRIYTVHLALVSTRPVRLERYVTSGGVEIQVLAWLLAGMWNAAGGVNRTATADEVEALLDKHAETADRTLPTISEIVWEVEAAYGPSNAAACDAERAALRAKLAAEAAERAISNRRNRMEQTAAHNAAEAERRRAADLDAGIVSAGDLPHRAEHAATRVQQRMGRLQPYLRSLPRGPLERVARNAAVLAWTFDGTPLADAVARALAMSVPRTSEALLVRIAEVYEDRSAARADGAHKTPRRHGDAWDCGADMLGLDDYDSREPEDGEADEDGQGPEPDGEPAAWLERLRDAAAAAAQESGAVQPAHRTDAERAAALVARGVEWLASVRLFDAGGGQIGASRNGREMNSSIGDPCRFRSVDDAKRRIHHVYMPHAIIDDVSVRQDGYRATDSDAFAWAHGIAWKGHYLSQYALLARTHERFAKEVIRSGGRVPETVHETA